MDREIKTGLIIFGCVVAAIMSFVMMIAFLVMSFDMPDTPEEEKFNLFTRCTLYVDDDKEAMCKDIVYGN